jgi:hypothetical protein
MTTGFEDIPAIMLESFRQMSEEQQQETVMLAGNARFVLRMTEGVGTETVAGETVHLIRNALIRGIPSLGGKDP